MHVGHINLAKTCNGAGEYFVDLVEALQRLGVAQFVLVRSVELAKRLDLIDDVTVGPVVRSAVMAYCLGMIPNAIWFGRTPRSVVMDVIDGVAYGLITGAIFVNQFDLTLDLWMLAPKDLRRVPRVRAVLDFLAEQLPALLDPPGGIRANRA